VLRGSAELSHLPRKQPAIPERGLEQTTGAGVINGAVHAASWDVREVTIAGRHWPVKSLYRFDVSHNCCEGKKGSCPGSPDYKLDSQTSTLACHKSMKRPEY
jgi:hypothetical protein